MRVWPKVLDAALGVALGGLVFAVAAAQSRGTADRAAVDAPGAGPAADPQTAVPLHARSVADYTMTASLDPKAHTLHGQATITWRNTSVVSVHELWFHLYLNAFKNERSLFLRAPGGSGRGTSPVTDWGFIDVKTLVARELDGVDLWPGADRYSPNDADDQTDIRVPLPRELPAGATLTLDVEWDARLPNVVERTGFAGDFHMVAQWFPKLARLEANGQWRHFPFYHLTEFYADFGSYDVTIDVPAGTVVGATGTRVSLSSEGGRDRARYQQSDVHDFAWTAWSQFREKSATLEGVAVRVLYPPGYGFIADRELATLAFALRYFGEHYGAYPYPVLTIVHPPRAADEAGGMEYPTLITTFGPWYEPRGAHGLEAVTIHEFGHQYFYGLVATDEQLWPFLDEGINSYAEVDALEAWLGAGAAVDLLGVRVGVDATLRLGTPGAAMNEPVAQPAQAFASGADYGALVYRRTATLLRTLGGVYGKESMREAVGRYTRRYRFEHPGVDQFVGTVREVMGAAAAQQLEEGLFRKGWVDYLVADAFSKRDESAAGLFDREGKRETITRNAGTSPSWVGSALVVRHGTLTFPVNVVMWGADGTEQVTRWDGSGDWVRLPYRGASELVRVVVDPDRNVTADENLFNNARDVAGGTNRSRTLERLTYFAELVLHGLLP
jgi:hypothetical protein